MNRGGRKCYTLPETNMTSPLKNGGKPPGRKRRFRAWKPSFSGGETAVSFREGLAFLKTYTSKELGLRNPSIRIWLHPFSATKQSLASRIFSTKKAVEFSKESLTPKSFVGLNVKGVFFLKILKTLVNHHRTRI